MSAHAIEVDDLVIRYGDLTAVDGVSFTAPGAKITAVLGPNGAGKTSTIEALEGYRRPAAGSMRVLGLDPVADHRRLVTRVGIMLQTGGVYRGMTVQEAADLFAAYYPEPLDPNVLIDRVGLGDRRRSPWRTLSGGEQQRLSLALALVGRPELVFLDEPSAGLDVGGRRLIHELIRDLRADGVAVVLATHDLDEAEGLADHVVILDQGRVVAEGTIEALRSGQGPGTVRFAASPGIDTVALAARLEARVVEHTPGEYEIERSGDPSTIADLTAWLAEHQLDLADLRAGRRRLEDVFVQLTSESGVTTTAPVDQDGHGNRRGRGRRPRRRQRS